MLQLLQLNPPAYKSPRKPKPNSSWAKVQVMNEERAVNDLYRNHGGPDNWTGIIIDSEMTGHELILAFLDSLPSDSSIYSENLAWDRFTPNSKGRVKLLSRKELLDNLYLWKIEDEDRSMYPLEKAEIRTLTTGGNYYIFPGEERYKIGFKISLNNMAVGRHTNPLTFINDYEKGTI